MAPTLSTLVSSVLERFGNKKEKETTPTASPSFPHFSMFRASGSRQPWPSLSCSALPAHLYLPVPRTRSPQDQLPDLFSSNFSTPRSALTTRGERQMVFSYRRKKPERGKPEEVGTPKFFKCVHCRADFTYFYQFHAHYENNHLKLVRKNGEKARPHIVCKNCYNKFLDKKDLEDHKPSCNRGYKKHQEWERNYKM